MNSVGKPKNVKLWKNPATLEKTKRQKNKNFVLQGEKQKSKFNSTISNSEFEVSDIGKEDEQNVESKHLKKSNLSQESNKKQQNKRKSDHFQDSTSNKKVKWSNRKSKSKEWTISHLQKKGKEYKLEIGKSLKMFWEELRRKDCKPDRKSHLLKQVCELLKGRVKEFTFAHDTVRVLECVFALGAETHRTLLFEELKSEIIPLAKSKYGKYFLEKVLKYGTKEHKEIIMKSFHGKVLQLICHTEAAEVLEMAFNECANASQRFEFVQEFYGANYRYFKTADFHSLNELLENHPEQKPAIIKSIKEAVVRVLEKSVVKHSIVHHVLLQFMIHSDQASKSETIESLREVVPEILHTRDGSRVAMNCIWHGTQKDRKIIIKSMIRFVVKIAKEEHGHMVLLALFDSIDDTKILLKKIIRELVKNLAELSKDVHGRKVLIYLLNPRDPHFIHPDVVNILKGGDNNEVSKKDPEIRRSELASAIANPLLELIKSSIGSLYTDNAFCLFAVTVLKLTVENRKEAFQAIAELAEEPYNTENKNTHVIEHKGSSFMLKQLILHVEKESPKDCTFCEVLMNTVPTGVLKSWIECNRGAFLLVSLLETKLPFVIRRVRDELTGCKSSLAKKHFKGAEILLKKLRE